MTLHSIEMIFGVLPSDAATMSSAERRQLPSPDTPGGAYSVLGLKFENLGMGRYVEAKLNPEEMASVQLAAV
jgi:hypothetical protein